VRQARAMERAIRAPENLFRATVRTVGFWRFGRNSTRSRQPLRLYSLVLNDFRLIPDPVFIRG